MRILALLTDAFGGRGGLAKFNRDMLKASCAHEHVEEVVALPRIVAESFEATPERLVYATESAGGKIPYLRTAWSKLTRDGPFDLVICGHLNLLPLAAVAARLASAPLLLVVHGVEAWQARRMWPNWILSQVDAFVAVSSHTKRRFLEWSGLPAASGFVVPNCVDLCQFAPGAKPQYLLDRYGLDDRRILLSVSRLDRRERYKGHDEVISVLSDLTVEFPDLAYVIIGAGDDRERLREKVRRFGLQSAVTFTGYVPDSEKADHYRLADAFVMPGRGEGFGIVYLEALACGLPIVTSSRDASQEILAHDVRGIAADPDDPQSILRAIRAVLQWGPTVAPCDLSFFCREKFDMRWHAVLSYVLGVSTAVQPLALVTAGT